MAWEIRKAIELKKKLVAAKTDSTNNSPTAIQGVGASWSTIFNFDAIRKAMNGREPVVFFGDDYADTPSTNQRVQYGSGVYEAMYEQY